MRSEEEIKQQIMDYLMLSGKQALSIDSLRDLKTLFIDLSYSDGYIKALEWVLDKEE